MIQAPKLLIFFLVLFLRLFLNVFFPCLFRNIQDGMGEITLFSF